MYDPTSSLSRCPSWSTAAANAILLATIIIASVGLPLAGLYDVLGHAQDGPSSLALVIRHAYWMLHDAADAVFTNPLYYVGFPVLFLLQALRPGIANARLLSRGLATDLVWMFTHTLMWLAVVGVFMQFANRLVAPFLDNLHIGHAPALPAWLTILIGFLVGDLLGWLSHLVRHKIKVFWFFHEIHHSQAEMNPFTPYRSHPIDKLISSIIVLIPAMFFENTLGISLLYLSVFELHDAFVHSNIRVNLGWLGLVVVTPQVHRLHHSMEIEHYDKNMGGVLCIWDRIFGTYAPGEQICHETGIADTEFPLETRTSMSRWPFAVPAQLLYPYKKAIRYVLGPFFPARTTRAGILSGAVDKPAGT